MNKLPEQTGGMVPRRPSSVSRVGHAWKTTGDSQVPQDSPAGAVRPRAPDHCSSEKIQVAFEGSRLQFVAKTDGF